MSAGYEGVEKLPLEPIRRDRDLQAPGSLVLAEEAVDEAVARMRQVYDKRRKLMVELTREVDFGIPVMPQGAFYVFADASLWTDDSYAFAFELLEKAGVGLAPGVDFGQAGRRAVRFRRASSRLVDREGYLAFFGFIVVALSGFPLRS